MYVGPTKKLRVSIAYTQKQQPLSELLLIEMIADGWISRCASLTPLMIHSG